MRRILLCGCLSLLVLSSCAKQGAYPPDEVLRRAALASAQLQSALFDVHADGDGLVSGSALRASLALQGTLQQGGKENAFHAVLTGNTDQKNIHYEFSADADVASAANGDMAFQMHTAAITPPSALLQDGMTEQLLGKWWSLPSGRKDAAAAITPDPALLRAQSQVVKVTQDRGLETLDGDPMYHYAVAIDPAKLLTFLQQVAQEKGETFDAAQAAADLGKYRATGELWIDAQTWYVHRLSWDIRTVASSGPLVFHVTLTANLHDQDKAPAIAYPKDTTPFSLGALMQHIMTGSMLPPSSGSSISRSSAGDSSKGSAVHH